MITKEAIKKEFMKIYSKKEYAYITVKEVCKNTPVARTTFYSYYNNLDDVKAEIEDDLITGIANIALDVAKTDISPIDFSYYFAETLHYILKNQDSIYIFLVAQPNLRFIFKWKEAIKKNLSALIPNTNNISNYDLISETIASGIISAYSYWLTYPEKVDTDELHKMLMYIINNSPIRTLSSIL